MSSRNTSSEVDEVVNDYKSSLEDLTSNSRPQITCLTMLAEESQEHANAVVDVILDYAYTVEAGRKLPCLYLIDSIIKNVKGDYIKLFQTKIQQLFAHIFEKVDEKTRKKMYELRLTWNEIFRKSTLFGLDFKVNQLDPAWPVTVLPTMVGGGSSSSSSHHQSSSSHQQPSQQPVKNTIFVNPSVFKNRPGQDVGLISKELELLELQKKKLRLEKERAKELEKKLLEKQQKVAAAIDPISSKDPSLSIGSVKKPTSVLQPPSSTTGKSAPPIKKNPSSTAHMSREEILKSYKIKKKGLLPATSDKHQTPSSSAPSAIISSTSPLQKTSGSSASLPVNVVAPINAATVESPVDKKTSRPTNIHVDPRRASAVLPPLLSGHTPSSVATTAASNKEAKSSSQSSVSSRDPRVKADARSKPASSTPIEKPTVKDNKTSCSSLSSSISSSSSKARSSSKHHKSKETPSGDREQLFKPDVITKVPTAQQKIRIELSNDAPKPKVGNNRSSAGGESTTHRDPRMKGRDPRVKEAHKAEPPISSGTAGYLTPSSTIQSTSIDSRDPRVSTKEKPQQVEQQQQQQHKGTKTTEERRQVIKTALKNHERKEPKKNERSRSSRSPRKDRDSRSTSRSRDKKTSQSKSVERDEIKKSLQTAEVIASGSASCPNTPMANSAIKNTPSSSTSSAVATSTVSASVTSLSPVSVSSSCVTTSSSSASQDSFRSINSSNYRKRNLRKRTTPSPDAMEVDQPVSNIEDKASSSSKSKDAKKKAEETDSDESDHYEANKPQNSFLDKKGLTSNTGDIDLRLLNTQPKNIVEENADSIPVARVNPFGLFGSEDVDLRKIVASNSGKESTSSAITLNEPFQPTGAGDEDMRISRLPTETEKLIGPPRLSEQEQPLDKEGPSNWDKFREKNPEFKEYQRQRSSNSAPESPALVQENAKLKAKIRRHLMEDEDDSQDGTSVEAERHQKDGLKKIAQQAEEQLKKGNITFAEYNSTLQQVLNLHYKHENRRSSFREMSVESDVSSVASEKTGMPGPLPPPPMPPHMRMARGRHEGFHSGFGRGGRHFGGAPHDFAPDEWTGEPDLPIMAEDLLRIVMRESETRTIEIDSWPREIRTYGGYAIALIDNVPKQIDFSPSSHCDIVFDEGKFILPISTSDDYKEFTIEGEVHRVKLGVPTQELCLDGKGYQCFFGGKPISVDLAGRPRTISLRGMPPGVDIGKVPNTDFLLGKVYLTVNYNKRKQYPLYLDAKPQRVAIDGKSLVFKFIDKFTAVKINKVPFPVHFGGPPISISIRQVRKYLSFSSLPEHVIPGESVVFGMNEDALIPPYPQKKTTPAVLRPPIAGIKPPPAPPTLKTFSAGPPRLPAPGPLGVLPPPPFPKLHVGADPPAPDVPAVASTDAVPVRRDPVIIPGSYNTNDSDNVRPSSVDRTLQQPPPVSFSPAPPAKLDVSSLLQNLISAGIINTPATESDVIDLEDDKMDTAPVKEEQDTKAEAKVVVKSDKPTIKIKSSEELKASIPREALDENDEDWIEGDEGGFEHKDRFYDIAKMDFLFKTQQLRKRSSTLVSATYRGMQCSSCGMRYPAEHTAYYSHHLDWHFRQNKRELDSTKKVHARKFYLAIDDWMQFEEIEDIEERVPSMFEDESGAGEAGVRQNESMEEVESSVAVDSSEPALGVCPVCRDTFSQFFHHDTDEWHYKNAVNKDGVNYHPSCYEDLINQKEKEEQKKAEEERLEKEAEEEKIKKEDERIKKEEEEEEKRIKKEEEKLKKEEKVKKGEEENVKGVEDLKLTEKKEELEVKDNKSHEEKMETNEKVLFASTDESKDADTTLTCSSEAESTAMEVETTERTQEGSSQDENINATGSVDDNKTTESTEADSEKTSDGATNNETAPGVPSTTSDPSVPPTTSDPSVPPTTSDPSVVPTTSDPSIVPQDTEDAVPVVAEPVEEGSVTAAAGGGGGVGEGSSDGVVVAAIDSSSLVCTPVNTPPPAATEGGDSQAEPTKRGKKRKKQKKPVELIDHRPIPIKIEPIDPDDYSTYSEALSAFQIPPGVQVKEEKSDEPEIEETIPDEGIEEMDVSPHDDDLSMVLDTTGDIATSTPSTNLLMSSIDGNVEQTDAVIESANTVTTSGPKIRISSALGGTLRLASQNKDKRRKGPDGDVEEVSDSPIPTLIGGVDSNIQMNTQTNQEKGTVDENGTAEDEGVDSIMIEDDDIIIWDEFIPPPFTPNLKYHPKFEGAQITDAGITRVGIEESGLCSIM